MRALTAPEIHASFVNSTRREAAQAVLPDLSALDWDRLDYLGWTDPKNPRRAYVVTWVDDRPTGIVLRTADGATRRSAVCSWCEDVIATNEVSLLVAKRAGTAGRNGDTVGTLICADFACSKNVRRRPTIVEAGDDAEAVVQRRVAGLKERSERFVAAVARG
ncbi:FBP domain-containing protein [Cellulomonas triticagri]|uniref:FBP domain-containing protein n=1 Tax=Cellulomonas triticagri TaxID=2483352 RepID=A0A3M2JUI7_9CELL|nr:FBP domain-containing protein [Cellulomonas triticagri]RMI13828.1 FBP domain-containing protein [Cellulomonas triticagri]